MSDIIREFSRASEQQSRQLQRYLTRLTRAVRQQDIQANPIYSPQKPEVPGGIQPVFVVNMPVIPRGRR